MTITDVIPDETFQEPGFCIVGAGPVGLSLALSLARRGKPVLLLEAGGREAAADKTGAFAYELADPYVHAEAALCTRQGLGGTSSIWGGGCMPLDPIDLRRRDHVPMSGAPISYDDIAPYHKEAGDLLGVDGIFPDPAPQKCHNGAVDHTGELRTSRLPNISLLHREEIERSTNLKVCLNTRVLRIDLDPVSCKASALHVESGGRTSTISPRCVVLCCGGIQTTRLLLSLQRDHPLLFGGEEGPLGRYYSGHISGTAARIRLKRPDDARKYLTSRCSDGSLVTTCFSLHPELQKEHRLLNLYFRLTKFPLGDPGFESGALSAVHLGLSLRHGTSRYMSRYHPGHLNTEFEFGLNLLPHLRNVVMRPERTVVGLVEIIRTMATQPNVGPFLNYFNHRGIYGLHYHAEQTPDPESRVTLSDKCDHNGVPIPYVDIKIADRDIDSVIETHNAFDRWLREKDIGELDWQYPEHMRFEHIKSQSSDGYHQIGLTRMASTPRDGVVDGNLRVFGTKNLYISAPSVLPTGGRAHPTFPAAALAVRLAQQLASR